MTFSVDFKSLTIFLRNIRPFKRIGIRIDSFLSEELFEVGRLEIEFYYSFKTFILAAL